MRTIAIRRGFIVDLDLGDHAGVRVAGCRRHLRRLRIDGEQRHQEMPRPARWSCLAELRGDRDVLGRD